MTPLQSLTLLGYKAGYAFMPSKKHPSVEHSYEDLTPEAKRAFETQTLAIATAVLAKVTVEEVNKAAQRFQAFDDGPTPSIEFAIARFLQDRLASLTQSKQPAADASKADVSDDEVERVAKAIYHAKPRIVQWEFLDKGTQDNFRDYARAALSAMNCGERWGVFVEYVSGKTDWYRLHHGGALQTPDKTAAEAVADAFRGCANVRKTEVRPYPSTPQVQVPEEAVEAGARALASANRRTIPAGVMVMNAMEEPDWKPWKKHAESCLTAALPHLQRGVTK